MPIVKGLAHFVAAPGHKLTAGRISFALAGFVERLADVRRTIVGVARTH